MSDFLTPDTTLALLNASEKGSTEAVKKLQRSAKAQAPDKLEETAAEFEAMFLSEMMKPMFEGISTDPPFGGGKGEEIFRGLMLQEYGKLVSQTGGIGLADSLKEHMIKLQEDINHAEHQNRSNISDTGTAIDDTGANSAGTKS